MTSVAVHTHTHTHTHTHIHTQIKTYRHTFSMAHLLRLSFYRLEMKQQNMLLRHEN